MAVDTHKIIVRPLGVFARFLDIIMVPCMYIVSGTYKEAPQQTHVWNNTKLSLGETTFLRKSDMVFCEGKPYAIKRMWALDVRFHIPIMGGWRDYIVVSPASHESWHIGWVSADTASVSRIKVTGPIRMLLSSESISFFAISSRNGGQILLKKSGTGCIGDNGPYCHLPLL
jgi:hypothetical protein